MNDLAPLNNLPTYEFDYIVYIGRFRPPHLAHINITKQALTKAAEVIVLVGSAHQPRTIKNPWRWDEVAVMIRKSLGQDLKKRVHIEPLRDILYNDTKWVLQVQAIISAITRKTPNAKIGVIGHSKDESSYYLQMFPQWGSIDVPNIEDINASDIRKAMFTMDIDEFDLKIGRNLPVAIHEQIKAFMYTPEYDQLKREWYFIEAYKSAWAGAPYPPTFVTVDAVVVISGHVLLVRRRSEPGKGLYAMPGGFLDPLERIEDATIRELREETGLKVPPAVLQGHGVRTKVYDHPGRSLRGRTITHATLIDLGVGELPKVRGSDETEGVKWVPLSVFDLMEEQLFEDHYHIVKDMIDRVRD